MSDIERFNRAENPMTPRLCELVFEKMQIPILILESERTQQEPGCLSNYIRVSMTNVSLPPILQPGIEVNYFGSIPNGSPVPLALAGEKSIGYVPGFISAVRLGK
jgi:hypothetical protein